MASISIPIDALTSRFGLADRFNSVRSQSIATRFANLKPISEFLDFKRLSKPANFGEVQARVNYNLSYFSSNYAVVFVMLSVYSLLTSMSPMLLGTRFGRENRPSRSIPPSRPPDRFFELDSVANVSQTSGYSLISSLSLAVCTSSARLATSKSARSKPQHLNSTLVSLALLFPSRSSRPPLPQFW
jgi:hypothetical protein